MPPKSVTLAQISGDPQAHENLYVHAVYDQIAFHFSATRYKVSAEKECGPHRFNTKLYSQPWPIIAQFLSTLPTGSVGLDSGTGNGKYLPLPTDRPPGSVWTIGLDRSRNLLEIARTAGQNDQDMKSRKEVVWGDILGRGWRDGVFVCIFLFLFSQKITLITIPLSHDWKDYAISIATIHHLATHERRKLAVQVSFQKIKL